MMWLAGPFRKAACSLRCSASSQAEVFGNDASFPLFLTLHRDTSPVAWDQMYPKALVLENLEWQEGNLGWQVLEWLFFLHSCDGDQTSQLPAVRVLQLHKDHLMVLAVYLCMQGSDFLPRSAVMATWHYHEYRFDLPKQNRLVSPVVFSWPQLSVQGSLSGLAKPRCADQLLLLWDKAVLTLTSRLCVLHPRAMRWEQILKYE